MAARVRSRLYWTRGGGCGDYRSEKSRWDQFAFPFVAELLRARGIASEEVAFTIENEGGFGLHLKNLFWARELKLPNHPR